MSTPEEVQGLLWRLGIITTLIQKGDCFISISHAVSNCGYLRLYLQGKQQLIHRVLYYNLHPNTNVDLVIRHTCDNRACINPNHLIAGTKADNTRDMIDRGREVYTPLPKGVKHHCAKFTKEQIITIRSYGKRTTHKKLAIIYGVSAKTIEHIRNNISYKDI